MKSLHEIKKLVYKIVSTIPRGKVTTYGQIAKMMRLGSARPVGRVLHHNTDPERIPCHRVVFADGRISERYAYGGKSGQRKKLESEGVFFRKGKVDMRKSLLPDDP